MADVEIEPIPGIRYDFIRIHSLGFQGFIDWSPNRRFGLATGKSKKGGLAILFADGKERWRIPIKGAMDKRLTNDCVGVFQDGDDLVVFHADGVVFKKKCPVGLGKITDFKVTPEGLKVFCDLSVFVFDMSGRLLGRRMDEDQLYGDTDPPHSRWPRYNEAEAHFKKAQKGKKESLEKARELYERCLPQFTDSPKYQALCYRQLGALALLNGDKEGAIEHWRNAIEVDPKVGLKRQLAALEKQITR